MIDLQNLAPGSKVLELGGGDNPTKYTTVNVDVRKSDKVHFVVDFEEPNWPIGSDEFDVCISIFCIEHVSWRRTPVFVGEAFRVLKPGGRLLLVSPNTEAQMRHILGKPEFDGDEGSMLYGDQNYPENTHKAAFSPGSLTKLLQQAGFESVLVQPYGELATDMCVVATKPASVGTVTLAQTPEPAVQAQPSKPNVNHAGLTSEQRAGLFGKRYFENYQGRGQFYWDYPKHEIIARHVLARKPASVIEFGASRGYVTKRINDAGVKAYGVDISKHCYLTRAVDSIINQDLFVLPWLDTTDNLADLCFSHCFLEHVPEELLPALVAEMQRTCKRGLHGITIHDDGADATRCTLKPLEWWRERLPETHEVFDARELESGSLPVEYVKGDGKIKLNLGSFMTCFHHGWTNVDVADVSQFAQANAYNFLHHDVRAGLPQFGTETVSLIFHSHMLEHLSYKDGVAFLKECRRVARPDAFMRILVPDLRLLDATDEQLADLGEVNDGCANAKTRAGKIHALLHENHLSQYDTETLLSVLDEAGWVGREVKFRESECPQMLRETLDMLPCLSLTIEAKPKTT